MRSEAFKTSIETLTENTKILNKKIELENSLSQEKFKSFPVNYSALSDAITALDVDAVQIIMEQAKDTIFSQGVNIETLFEELFDTLPEVLAGFENVEARRDKILKIGLDFMPKEFVSLEILQTLSKVLSKQDFESFYKSKSIDIKSEPFKTLDLKSYELEDNGPILKNIGSNVNVVNLLLSRTYSEDMSLEQIEAIYQKLYKLHPIAKEMLTYTSFLISEHNDLKIIFDKDLHSSYNTIQNVIFIDSNFQNDPIATIESITIHEIGHYVNSQKFDFQAAPFTKAPIQNLVTKFYNKYKEHMEDQYNREMLPFQAIKDLANELNSTEFQEYKKMFDVYEAAARKPTDKAAELIKFNISEYAQYNYTKQYVEYFKDHSYIDLFQVNSALGMSIKNILNVTKLPDNVFDNFLRIYTEEEIQCKPENPFAKELSREEIINWGTDKFFPQLVSDLKLSPQQIHYLGRIGDYEARGEHILSEDNNNHHEAFTVEEKHVELIVRSMELKAANADQDNSFGELDAFHMNYTSPAIREEIEESYKQKFALYQEAMQAFKLDISGDNSQEDN